MTLRTDISEADYPAETSRFGRLWGWVAGLPRRLSFRWSAYWLRRRVKGGYRAKSRTLVRYLAEMPRAKAALFPATELLLQVQVLNALAREGNAAEFVKWLALVGKPRLAAPWDARSEAECVGRLIAACLAIGSERAVEQAKQRFVEFRRRSAERVREAFPLIVQVARRRYSDHDAARMYQEYLACSKVSEESREYRMVKTMDDLCFRSEMTRPDASRHGPPARGE